MADSEESSNSEETVVKPVKKTREVGTERGLGSDLTQSHSVSRLERKGGGRTWQLELDGGLKAA
jgi:hypothetical protein